MLMLLGRLICLFLCVGVSVEEVERNFLSVNLAKPGSVPQHQLHHYEKRIIPEGRPTVQVTRSEVKGQFGSNVTLECFMDSNPQATNFWMLGSARIYDNNTNYKIIEASLPHFRFRNRLRLVILSLDTQDYLETFRCFSHNKHGDDFGLINVQSVPPIVTTSNNTIGGYLGSDVTLECSVLSFPLASSYWFNSTGDQIVDSGRFSIFNEEPTSFRYKTQLQITKLGDKDFTSYKCMGRNRIGGSNQTINLVKLKGKPPKSSEIIKAGSGKAYRSSAGYLVIVSLTVLFSIQAIS